MVNDNYDHVLPVQTNPSAPCKTNEHEHEPRVTYFILTARGCTCTYFILTASNCILIIFEIIFYFGGQSSKIKKSRVVKE